MIAVHFDGVSFGYTSEPIFENLSWQIHDNRCVGLIGPNGCGKSTLMQLINGDLSDHTGFIVRKKELTIGYLSQTPGLKIGNTVWKEVYGASSELLRIERKLEQIETSLADPEVYNHEKNLARTLEQQETLLKSYTHLGGPNYAGRVRSILENLGFAQSDMQLPVEVLSGGEEKLVGLAKLLLVKPDLLLLDEPDNHLDLEGKTYLENFIRGYKGAVIIVSHDRYLLDLVVDEIAELEDGTLNTYHGNYSEYAFEKQERLLRQQQLFQAQQKEINRLEQAAKRLLTWGKIYDNDKFSRRGQNILKRLEKVDRIDQPVLDRRTMGLELKGWTGSHKVLEIADLCKIFPANAADGVDEQKVLTDLNLLVTHDERVGLVGANGTGKSVLFRLLLGEDLPTTGEITIGPSVRIGYYAQQTETLDGKQTLIDTVRRAGEFSEQRAVAFLKRFLFTYEQANDPVKNLSGGEASRLQMALLMLSDANFLLLDEPTNHLDIASTEVLEDALSDFKGTLLVISHDRYFLDRVVQRIVELDDGSLTNYIGGYSDYCAVKKGL
jgi:ATP-binding cassette, subfamily F, member 3